MRNTLATLLALAAPLAAAERVLIVADEIPAMEVLARHFERQAKAGTQIVTQERMPAELDAFGTIAVYVHRQLFEAPEKAMLARTRAGGKLIVIHHSISSGKRKNQEWFPALGVTLPTEKLEAGGYGYYAPATFEVVNLAPGHPVTTGGVKYDRKVAFTGGKELDGFLAPDTEIFLNHKLEGERTPLLGIKWTDPRSGKEYMQETGGWHKTLDKGSIFYFMLGHRAEDFEIPQYARILVNALRYRK